MTCTGVGLGAALVCGAVAQAQTTVAYPSPELTQIAKTGKYVGSKACLECHEDEHKSWAASRHTIKATQGPSFGK